MMYGLLIVIVIIFGMLTHCQYKILQNQKALGKQQFHSDGIALVSLFGDSGLINLDSITDPSKLSRKEQFATGLLIQRYVAAYWIRDMFTRDEWEMMVIKDGQEIMHSPLMHQRWATVKQWYPKEIRDFIDNTLIMRT